MSVLENINSNYDTLKENKWWGFFIKANNKLLKLSAQKYKVLYVEDEETLRESTAELFEGLFKELVVAEDGQEALEYYTHSLEPDEHAFDIVISDIQMPNMSGIVLSREIVKLNKNQKIIIISAYNETEYFIELIKIGISGFMQKPLTSVQILGILYEVLWLNPICKSNTSPFNIAL